VETAQNRMKLHYIESAGVKEPVACRGMPA